MNYFFQFMILIVTSLITSNCCCDGGKADFAKFQLVNGTNFSVQLKGHDNFPNGHERFIINLPEKGSSWTSKRQKDSDPDGPFDITLALADSISIIFNRQKIYHESISSRRILAIPFNDKLSNFEIISIDKRNKIFRYTISELEYDLATELQN